MHQTLSICVQEGSGVPNLQTELNYLELFKIYCIFSDFALLGSGRVGQVGGSIWGDQL